MNNYLKYIHISRLITLSLKRIITPDERKKLKDWLNEAEENQTIFDSITRNKYWLHEQINRHAKYDITEGWDSIHKQISRKANIRKLYIKIAKYAAVFAIFAISSLVLIKTLTKESELVQVAQPLIKPGIKGAKLVMDNGEEISLSSENSFTLLEEDGTSIKKEYGTINYAKEESVKEVELSNTIVTTRGEEFSLILSDGTKVHLNAKSKIKFPVRFIKNERMVEVSGEAYLEVAHNETTPFLVKTDKSIIRVLGTRFNLRAYPDEHSEYTTLVGGSVSIRHRYDESSELELKPGDQAQIIDVNHRIRITKVDTDYYTAWTTGKFVFRGERLESIIKDLQRWYDFEVEFEHEQAKDIRFGARIDRYSEVNTIFNIINNTGLVQAKQSGKKFTITVIEEN